MFVTKKKYLELEAKHNALVERIAKLEGYVDRDEDELKEHVAEVVERIIEREFNLEEQILEAARERAQELDEIDIARYMDTSDIASEIDLDSLADDVIRNSRRELKEAVVEQFNDPHYRLEFNKELVKHYHADRVRKRIERQRIREEKSQ